MARQKMPPESTNLFSMEAEQAVIAGLLIDPSAFVQVRTVITAQDFYWQSHAEVFGAMIDLVGRGGQLTYVTLCEELERRGTLEDVVGPGADNGRSYLTSLLSSNIWPQPAEHCKIVRRYSLRRRLLSFAQSVAIQSHDAADPENVVTESLNVLAEMGQFVQGGLVKATDAVDSFVPKVTDWMTNPREVYGIPTGLIDLDRISGGMEATEFILIAGRPSVGKSALALQIAAHAAKQGHPVAYFSLEMSLPRILLRLACAEAKIDAESVRRGKVSDGGQQKIWQALAHIQQWPLWFLCQPGLSVGEVANEVAKLKARKGVDLAVVDYIQLMSGSGENENIRLTNISTGLARVAKSSNIVLLGLSQLSRGIEARMDPQPKLSDLRGSGSFEQDADKILFLWVDPKEEDLSQTDDPMQALRMKKKPRSAPMCLAKNRDGISGVASFETLFWGKYQQFLNKADYVEEPY